MRKAYVKPTSRVHECECVELCSHSGHHDNGNHHGWDNPHNPHYPGDGNNNSEEEDEG